MYVLPYLVMSRLVLRKVFMNLRDIRYVTLI